MKPMDPKIIAAKKRAGETPPIMGGAIGQDDIHSTGQALGGVRSGRGIVPGKERKVALRVSLWNELVYEDVEFVNRDMWEVYGIPDIFGDDQLVFFERRNKISLIIISKPSIIQIEARQG